MQTNDVLLEDEFHLLRFMSTAEGTVILLIHWCIILNIHGKDIRILTRVALQVFAAETTSGETERIGSDAGINYSAHRNALKPKSVKKSYI